MQGVLKEWNKRVFGNIFAKKRDLINHIKHLDVQMSLGWNATVLKEQEEA